MREFRRLIDRYGERYSTATIYVIFAAISLLVAAILFGVLHSTGIMKLMLAGAIQEAEFGGAFAGFLATLLILIRYYNTSTKVTKMEITGNVLFDDGNPTKGASVFVDGVDRYKETDATGWFTIEVNDQKSWIVRTSYQDQTAKKTVKRGDHQKPVRLILAKPPEPKMLYEKTGDKQIDDVLNKLNQLHLKHKNEPPSDAIFPLFAQLFQRAAFVDEVERFNPNGWKALLYAVTITEIILRDHRPIVAQMPVLVKDYDNLRNALLKLRKHIAAVFGEDFDAALHFDKTGMNKEKFVNDLPNPIYPSYFGEQYWEDANDWRRAILEYARLLFAA